MRKSFFDLELLDYMTAHGVAELPVMPALRQQTLQFGQAARMQIDAHQGQVMYFLMQLIGAKKILEIGTFTGMSSLWLARALPDDGELHCLDINGEWTALARDAWKKSGLENKIHLHLAPALETLPKFADGSFDAVFIDADKGNYPGYIEQSHRLLRRGGLMLIDNTLWSGDVTQKNSNDKIVKTIQKINTDLTQDARFHSIILPVGDGLSFAIKI